MNITKVVSNNKSEFKKSNDLINGKYKSTLATNKIMAIALSKIQNINDRPVAYLDTDDLRNAFPNYSKTSGSFYDKLKNVSDELLDLKIIVEDYNTNSFKNMNLIGVVSYFDGELTIQFEPNATEYLLNINKHYTLLNLSYLLSFSNNYSFRLYEMLRSKAYGNQDLNNDINYSITYNLSELKLDLGLVDYQSILKEFKKKNIDYDYIVNNVAKTKKYSEFREFKRKVLDIAIQEINTYTDLFVTYSPIRTGKGGKTTGVIFNFKKKN